MASDHLGSCTKHVLCRGKTGVLHRGMNNGFGHFLTIAFEAHFFRIIYFGSAVARETLVVVVVGQDARGLIERGIDFRIILEGEVACLTCYVRTGVHLVGKVLIVCRSITAFKHAAVIEHRGMSAQCLA